MDQIKEYLQLAVKYRFWIAVGVACLLPLIGYFATAGSIAEEEAKATATIKSSNEAVKKFENISTPVNKDYQPAVKKQTTVLQKDVNTAWRKLYSLQEPLLTWPASVSEEFTTWGRTWPKELAANVVRDTIMTYIETYEPYWRDVYQAFQPFDPETGEGIVAAPPAEALLRPATFDVNKPPTLGKVWDAQEKLWVQRTVLQVIGDVNQKAGAKDWLSAAIKQILELEVANDEALDEKSIALGTTFGELEEIEDPNAAPKPETEAGSTDTTAAMQSKMGGMGAMGMSGMGGMGGASSEPDVVKYITDDRAAQVYIAPIYLRVYCQQEAIPNLITEFANSPMNIQVKQVAIYKPDPHSVIRPMKGDKPLMMSSTGRSGGYGMMGDMMSGGYGGMGGSMSQMMGKMGSSGGYGMDMSNYGGRNQGRMTGGYNAGSYGAMGGGRGGRGQQAAAPKKQGKDVTAETIKKRQEAREKAQEGEEDEEEDKKKDDDKNAPDPYYDVVEVRIWGHARFFKMPEKETEPQSESETTEPADPAPTDQPAANPAQPESAPAMETQPATEPEPAPAAETAPTNEGDTPAQPPSDEPASPAESAPAPDSAPTPAEPGSAPAPAEPSAPAEAPATPSGEPAPGAA